MSHPLDAEGEYEGQMRGENGSRLADAKGDSQAANDLDLKGLVDSLSVISGGKRRSVWCPSPRPLPRLFRDDISQCETLEVHKMTDVALLIPASSQVSSITSVSENLSGPFRGGRPFACADSDVSSLSSISLPAANDVDQPLPLYVLDESDGNFLGLASTWHHHREALISPLTKILVASASIDAWWSRAHEFICIVLPLLYYTISIAIAVSWEPNFVGSRLYESIDLRAEFGGFQLGGWLLTMCSINISSGASQLLTTSREMLRSSSWPPLDRRLELVSRFYTVAPMLVFSIVLLLASIDPDDHHRRSRIAALVIWLVWALAFSVPCSVLGILVHPNEAFLRPAVLDPIMIVTTILVLLGQAKTCDFIAGDENFLPNIVTWVALLFYLACGLCLCTSVHRLHRLHRHGEPLPGRFYDSLAIAVFLLRFLNLYNFAGLGNSGRLVVSGANIDFAKWLMLRLAPGSVYLTVWAVRCSEILLERAEKEAKLCEEALQELDRAKLNHSGIQFGSAPEVEDATMAV